MAPPLTALMLRRPGTYRPTVPAERLAKRRKRSCHHDLTIPISLPMEWRPRVTSQPSPSRRFTPSDDEKAPPIDEGAFLVGDGAAIAAAANYLVSAGVIACPAGVRYPAIGSPGSALIPEMIHCASSGQFSRFR